jgi:hypothetical protein
MSCSLESDPGGKMGFRREDRCPTMLHGLTRCGEGDRQQQKNQPEMKQYASQPGTGGAALIALSERYKHVR